MELLAVNLRAGLPLRRAQLRGRTHLVAPATLIVPGVLNGSAGPLLYPDDELRRSVPAWNGMPIVVYHPTDGTGGNISARSPEVLDRQGVGVVLNASMNGKLTAELWIDVEALERIDVGLSPDVRVLPRLQKGKPVELSTGLFTTNEPTSGTTTNGIAYTAVAREHQPDHLAILPDQQGACSLSDGCGVLVNKEDTDSNDDEENTMAKLTDNQRKELVDNIVANCECWTEEDREVLNNFDDTRLQTLKETGDREQQRTAVANAAIAGFTDPNGVTHRWNSETGKYESTAPPPTDNAKDGKGKKRKAMNEDEEEEEEKPVKNAQPQTADEWFASAPPEIQSAVRNAMDIEAREKNELADRLTANVKEVDRDKAKAELLKNSLEQLRFLSSIMPPPAEPAKPKPSYLGANAPTGNTAHDDYDKDDVLPPTPTINWADVVKERQAG